VLVCICQYMTSSDALQLRITSSKLLEFFQNSDEASIVWRNALVEDFAFDANSSDYLQTLGIHPQWRQRTKNPSQCLASPTQERTSVFGYGFSDEGSVFTATSAFESWKHWSKASNIFLLDSDENKIHLREKINGPYFLRAANIWKKIDKWCRSDDSGDFGDKLLRTFIPGTSRADGRFIFDKTRPVHAFEAIFAFCDGQEKYESMTFNPDNATIALFGGYKVYNHTNFMRLCPTDDALKLRNTYRAITLISFNYNSRLTKCIGTLCDSNVDGGKTGMLTVLTNGDGFRACKIAREDNGLVWMEAHAARLEKSFLEVSTKVNNRFSILSSFPSTRCPAASRKVTNGIEVIASSIGAVEIEVVVYSIRIRLLKSGEDGYLSPSERGFQTCQLRSRHWRIYDRLSGEVDRVSGEGVIGLYPLLFEGGYRNDQQNMFGSIENGEEKTEIFQYQSCANIQEGTFQGKIEFVPGSLGEPTSDAFFVDLAEVALKQQPDICY